MLIHDVLAGIPYKVEALALRIPFQDRYGIQTSVRARCQRFGFGYFS